MRLFVTLLIKHLPPSASALRLLDWSGSDFADGLIALRPDLVIKPERDLPPASADAIVAQTLDDVRLNAALDLLRPGGRLIMLDADGAMDKRQVGRLEDAGFTRILVEPLLDDGSGVLMRGEKPHQTSDRLARVQIASERDSESDLAGYRGHFVYLLIIQTPNRPVWARGDDEPIRWRAVAADGAVLVFSSLPKAVAFMQRAVLSGQITGVNKIAKFRKESVASLWTFPLRLNPDSASLDGRDIALIEIDPSLAEAPDE
jgi:hypothetical protein